MWRKHLLEGFSTAFDREASAAVRPIHWTGVEVFQDVGLAK
jgi:hypothetical protein